MMFGTVNLVQIVLDLFPYNNIYLRMEGIYGKDCTPSIPKYLSL
jgi:hypothetical protein